MLQRRLPRSCLQRTLSTPRTSQHLYWAGQVVWNESLVAPGTILVDAATGIIQEIGVGVTEIQAQPAAINLGAQTTLLPGLVDVHCHISGVGRDWEGYRTATRAAAAGGLTTLIAMPLNSIPATTSREALQRELQAATDQLWVDVGFWGGIVPENCNQQLDDLVKAGVFGLKAFLSPLPPASGFQAVTPEELGRAASICGKHGKPILVHSELMTEEEMATALAKSYAEGGDTTRYASHVASRPPEWEQRAVDVVTSLTDRCDMHIVHLSDAGCLERIRETKRRPTSHRLTVETCPHYLAFDADSIPDGETRLKCVPPIRSKDNQRQLWEALQDGSIDMIASDHSPCTPDMRLADNLRDAWAGIAALQYQLPLTASHGHTMAQLAHWWSTAPAQFLGLMKGRLQVGYQADFVAVDAEHVGPPSDYSREHHRWSVDYFSELPLRGRVMGTWVKGRQVYDGESDSFAEDAVGSILLSR